MSEDLRSLKSQAAQRLREGRMAEAAAIFEKLAAVEPEEANHWFNLGYSQRMARRYRPALEAYAEALRRGVAGPEEVHINRAAILSEYLHDMAAAAEELRQAVAHNPRAVTAWLNLGNLHEDLGDVEGARQAYAKALDIDPGNGRAIARIAGMDLYEQGPDRVIPALRTAADRPPSTAQDAAEIRFALASALDSAGDYDAAFEVITEANQLATDGRHPSLRYNRVAQERLIDGLIGLPPLPSAGAFAMEESPIFICGMFRSGSTLVEQLLARHPKVIAGGELEFIPALVHEELLPYPQSLAEASTDRLSGLRDKYLSELRELFPVADRVTDKRPDNFLHVALIKAMFPSARVVHTVRHPLDNILSAYFLFFGDDVRYSDSLDDLVHYYVQYRRLMDHWRARYGKDIHDVDYDALVADPRAQLEQLLSFCGLDWNDACLTLTPSTAVRTASNWQVRKPLHAKSSGRWKHYAQALEPARRRLIEAGLLR